MSMLEFCLEILKRESTKFNVGIDARNASQITAATASDISFDVAHNRCAYLFRCGAITLSFAMDCFRKFLADHNSMVFLLSKWVKSPELTVCSLSKGPALDYIALLLSYQMECNNFPSLFKNAKVISKYGAWRNTVNIMLEVLNGGYFQSIFSTMPVSSIEVIQGDPLENLNDKIKQPIGEADIVLMMKTLNLQATGYDQNKIAKSLQDFLSSLKPGAVIFCIDTKPSISVITSELGSLGNFLYGPTHINTMINVEAMEFYKNIFGCTPVTSARGSFFVWEKSSSVSIPNGDGLMGEVSESVKRLLNIKSISNCYGIQLIDRQDSEQQEMNEVLLTSSYDGQNYSKPPQKVLKPEETMFSIKELSAGLENLNYDFASTSFENFSGDFYSKTENDLLKNSVSIDESIQTESDESTQENASKVAELTNKIAQLTRTLSDMLETSELSLCMNEGSLSSENECKESISNNCIHNHCLPLPQHGCQCRNHSWPTTEQCIASKCCQTNPCHQGIHTPNHYNSNISLDRVCENSKHRCSCDNVLKLSPENDSNTGPKLVIPLNSLSTDVVSQIISLISQPNEK